jgi:glycosyltransferase involved in cell wall biosynthesis
MDSFICAFRGRRDSYQVPLALFEGGLLDQFITDAYAVPWVRALSKLGPASVRAKVDFRNEPGVPVERVRCLWRTTVLERTRHALGFDPSHTFNKVDRLLSLAAARRAAQTRRDLLLYSPYAWEAFTERYPHTPRKVLFQHHPHPALQRLILAEDSARHPGVSESFSGTEREQVPEECAYRERDAWKYADLIFCASAFSRRSLLEVGCDEKVCRIVPYGIDVPAVAEGEPPTDAFQAVFVGSGEQRKGLHHLLRAWQRAALPKSSKLTLVCRVLNPEIEHIAVATPRVEIIRGVPLNRLNAFYARSSLFVMPSLVEGFGQVYLEALAQGCPVLGTANTCVPDLGGEAEGIFLVTPGNIDDLTAKLEQLARILSGNRELRRAARSCAAKFTWPAFREGIRRALQN